jgi:hypothetical protein
VNKINRHKILRLQIEDEKRKRLEEKLFSAFTVVKQVNNKNLKIKQENTNSISRIKPPIINTRNSTIEDSNIRFNNISRSQIYDTSTISIKKSPYYFNDPKFSKFIDLKHKYGNKFKSDFNLYSENGSFAEDEIM